MSAQTIVLMSTPTITIQVLRSKNGIILPPEQYEQMNAELKNNAIKVEELEMRLVP